VWRSARFSGSFSDEANQMPMSASRNITLKLRWESQDKRWNVEAYAANLLKRNVENLIGVNPIARF